MQHLVNKFLTKADRARIEEAVKAAEKTTAGEIVPMVVSASFDYPRAELLGALVLGLVAATGASLVLGMTDMWSFMAFLVVGLVAFQAVMHVAPALKRLFIPSAQMLDEVEEGAVTAFYKYGLYRTRDETGILIYVSIFERKVWVLADRGINEKVDPKVWQELVDTIVSGIRTGTQAEAICTAIRRCGEILTEHFPIKEDDTDELTNLIVEGD